MFSGFQNSSTTYKVRIEPETAGTLRMNGINTGRFFGGVARSTLILEEIVS
jgi:hypothetical protein